VRTHCAGIKVLVGPEADAQWLREREAEAATLSSSTSDSDSSVAA
jgi:hypothetical protein